MKFVLLLLLITFLSAVVCATKFDLKKPCKTLFGQWLGVYKHKFTSSHDRQVKYKIFCENLKNIINLNRKHQAHYDLGPHALIPKHEFNKRLGHRAPTDAELKRIPHLPTHKRTLLESLANAPASKDWRKNGKVTPVKNQGQCGSCWTFSTTGNVESAWMIAGHKELVLSEQQIVDCDTQDNGCHGGWMGNAMEYIHKNGGLHTEAAYPYRAAKGKCRHPSGAVATVTSFYQLPKSPTAIQQWVGTKGPVSIVVDADTWQHYRSGVIGGHCGATPNHGVLIVGYTTVKGAPVWIVKNSWGKAWGMNGYAYVHRGTDDACGIDNWAVTAVI